MIHISLFLAGAPPWRPETLTLVERQMTRTVVRHGRFSAVGGVTRTVVRHGRLSAVGGSILAYRPTRETHLPEFSSGNPYGDMTRMSPDGKVLAITGLRNGKPALALVPSGRGPAVSIPLDSPMQVEWSPAADRIAVVDVGFGGETTDVKVFDLRGRRVFRGGSGTYRIAWTRDGGRLLCGKKLRAAKPVSFRELLNRGSGMPEPTDERTAVTAFDRTTWRGEVVDVDRATEAVVGRQAAKILKVAVLLLWSPETRGGLRFSSQGMLVMGAAPVKDATEFDVLLTGGDARLIPRVFPNLLGAIDFAVLDTRHVGYASDSSIFKGQKSPPIEGVKLTLYDAAAKRPRMWTVRNCRGAEYTAHWVPTGRPWKKQLSQKPSEKPDDPLP